MTPQEEIDIVKIHLAIHNLRAKSIMINGQTYPIQVSPNNLCRYIEYNGITFMEQNSKKDSRWAVRVRMGDEITWGIRPGKWILIINGAIQT